jgi:hypothetical protein
MTWPGALCRFPTSHVTRCHAAPVTHVFRVRTSRGWLTLWPVCAQHAAHLADHPPGIVGVLVPIDDVVDERPRRARCDSDWKGSDGGPDVLALLRGPAR